ncbi:MAG: hypothetical protein LBT30_05925 [Clostridiales bacterium]|jgi:hypothetical protein|nr:hypothetical protein [Clostridiales bacterium]
MKKTSVLKIIAYLLGFPVIAAYAVYKSVPAFTLNSTYKPFVFAGLFLLILVAILYFTASLVTGSLVQKKKTAQTARRCTAVMVTLSVVLTAGVWFAIDKVVPPILSNATQNILGYDDFKEDYDEKARVHSELLAGFIDMNIANGRLSPENADLYRLQGYGNKDVKNLIEQSYNSLNNDGYNSFNGMLLSLADGSRLTIPVLIHLLFDERDDPSTAFPGYTGEGRGDADKDAPIKWSILDIQEGTMTFSLDLSAFNAGNYDGLIKWLLPALFGEDGMVEELLKAVEAAVADEDLLGSPIYVDIDYSADTVTVSLTPSSASRGVYDFKNMSFLNSNHLLVAVISLFPIRNAFYIFGAFLTLSTLVVGMLRQKQYANKKGGAKS